jgi:hypothetical protein
VGRNWPNALDLFNKDGRPREERHLRAQHEAPNQAVSAHVIYHC